jgi:hypothetical protein
MLFWAVRSSMIRGLVFVVQLLFWLLVLRLLLRRSSRP